MKTTTLILSLIIITSFTLAQVPPPALQQGEYWTKLFSASYDYQTNGSVRYIVQDPTNPLNLAAIIMAQEDSTNAVGVGRYVYLAYSSDGGKNWEKYVTNNSANHGFPSLSVRNGVPIVVAHKSSALGSFLYSDVTWNAGVFSLLSPVPLVSNFGIIWPHMCVTSNGNVVIAAVPSPAFTGYYTAYNGTTWTTPTAFTNISGPSGNFATESGPGGSVFIFGIDYNSAITYGNYLYTSTDNGVTFTQATGGNAPPVEIPSGTGSVLAAYIDGGRTGLYAGNEIHLVYTVYDTNSVALASPPNTTWFKSCKIIHWSQSTGIDTVAARYNMPTMADTLTQALVTPLCHPSMGYYNGYIYVIYTAFLRGNKQTVQDGSQVNAGEIFLTRSSDNGNTWSAPVNLTNTPFIEEKHPSAVRSFNLPAGDSVGVYYLRDLKAGGWVNYTAWGKAPVYGIYKKVGANVLGIQQQLELAREFKLFQNYPNPFNPTTTISYNLQKASFVTLKIYNILGEEVKILVNEDQKSGAKEILFDAGSLPSGVYFYTLSAGEFRDTKIMILIK
jgi:hypothetical protein